MCENYRLSVPARPKRVPYRGGGYRGGEECIGIQGGIQSGGRVAVHEVGSEWRSWVNPSVLKDLEETYTGVGDIEGVRSAGEYRGGI